MSHEGRVRNFLSRKLRCYTRISDPEKSHKNTHEKISFFLSVLILPISCWHVTRLWHYSFRLMNERQSLHDSQYKLYVGASSNYGGLNAKKSVSLIDSVVQTFLEGEGNHYTKRKTESYIFSGFGVSISLGWEWKSTTGRFATSRFWRFTWKTSSVGKDKVNNWEFCKLKITTIVVFVIMIQRVFPS